MKATILTLALTMGLCAAGPSFAQSSVGQDAKDAAHDTKTASEKGATKTTNAVKKGVKKSTHATKKGVKKSTEAVTGKTDTTTT